jgi:hypothetical protein
MNIALPIKKKGVTSRQNKWAPKDENKNNRNINNNCRDKIKQRNKGGWHTHTKPIWGGSQSRDKILGLKTNGKLAMHLRSCRV